MAGGSNSFGDFILRKSELIMEVTSIQGELSAVRTDIRNKAGTCERIQQEIALHISPKFTEFHNIYMDGEEDWLAELGKLKHFRDIMDDAGRLQNFVNDCDKDLTSAMNDLQEFVATVGNKQQSLKQIFSQIQNASCLAQLDYLELNSCRWESNPPLPDLETLENNWRDANVAEEIQALIDELSEFVEGHPGMVLAQIDAAGSSSSSSDHDLQGGMSRLSCS